MASVWSKHKVALWAYTCLKSYIRTCSVCWFLLDRTQQIRGILTAMWIPHKNKENVNCKFHLLFIYTRDHINTYQLNPIISIAKVRKGFIYFLLGILPTGTICAEFAKGVLYMFPILWLWRGITSFINELLRQNFQSYKCNDRTVLLPNFKAVGQIQAELHSLKVEKLDACIRLYFANLITYTNGQYFCVWSYRKYFGNSTWFYGSSVLKVDSVGWAMSYPFGDDGYCQE